MKKIYFLLILIFALQGYIIAQTPTIKCLSVLDDGTVTIKWSNPSSFVNGTVWFKNEYMTTFTQVFSFSFSSDTVFNHTQSGADYQRTSYFISNQLTTGVVYSDTLNTYFVTSELTDNAYIKLNWNKLRNDQISLFYIDREENGVWHHLSQTDTTYFVDSITSCVSDYRYRIHSEEECLRSNATIPLVDITAPVAPQFDSVSIINNQYVVLGWQRSTSDDAAGYRIYKKQPIGWDILLEIHNPDSLFAIDTSSFNFCEEERTYCIVTIDRCGNTTPINEAKHIYNLVLHQPILDTCNKSINLSWSSYAMNLLSPQLGGFRIIYSKDGGPYQLAAVVTPNLTSYSFDNPERNSTYEFQIQAVNNLQTITASSCSYQVFVSLPKEPDFGFIRYVSVNNGFVDICFEVDTQSSSPIYQLLRSNSGSNGTYQVIQTLNPTGNGFICTTDLNVDVNHYSYFYKFQTLDSCFDVFEAPLIARNIVLSTSTNTQSNIELQWIVYDGFINGFNKYLIYRKIDNEPYTLIDQTFNTNYVDNNPQAENFETSLWYRVAAISNDIIPDTAWSNYAQYKLKSFSVFFPNAFKPNEGINNIFKPVYVGINVKELHFIIYNRWGEQVFVTTNANEGWNGKSKNGEDCSAGTYSYNFLMTDENGNRYQKTGSIILLK